MASGITAHSIQTERLRMAYLAAGSPENPAVILVHGNVSSSLFWRGALSSLSPWFYVLAPDLRGFGDSEPLAIDAARGVRDWSDDLRSFVVALNLPAPCRLVGWSLGGGVVMQYGIDHPADVFRMALISPLSPFGFGGTKNQDGEPIHSDFAGSGGGTVNASFIERLRSRDTGSDSPNSPRNIMNQFYFKPPFQVSMSEENLFVDAMLSTRIGSDFYPGSYRTSEHWPGVAPGEDGVANAMSPKYINLSSLAEVTPQFPILWIRGADDQIVSDASLFDFGALGKLGAVPGWPGEAVYPPQPMVAQLRSVLDRFRTHGGEYEEFVVADAGHAPHIEKPDLVLAKIAHFFGYTKDARS
ncbi:MAG: alpha/beta hydrolase [Bacilli bacterium]